MSYNLIPINFRLFLEYLIREGFILEKKGNIYTVSVMSKGDKMEVTDFAYIENPMSSNIFPIIDRINRLYKPVLDRGEMIKFCR